jgi:hypothetical protein
MHHFLDDNNRIFHNINDTNLQLIFLEIILGRFLRGNNEHSCSSELFRLSLYTIILFDGEIIAYCVYSSSLLHTL